METTPLATALRNKAAEVRAINQQAPNDIPALSDASELLRVLANVVDGMPILMAFGAPGDWGYESEIGQALFGKYSEKNP